MNLKTVEKLKDKFGPAVLDIKEFRDEVTVTLAKENLLAICNFLKTDPELKFNFLADVTSLDLFEKKTPRFEVIYHLLSHSYKTRIRLKIPVGEGERAPSVTGVWSTANWLEREIYDLMGIEFENHPDLRRILTADGWVGYPLRKDYPLTYEEPQFTHNRKHPPDLLR